jgi:exodeoxyribonuclease VII small subunit
VNPGDQDVLDRLEKAIARLADGTAPLEELVAAHEQALKLLAEAEAELQTLRARSDDLSRQLAG